MTNRVGLAKEILDAIRERKVYWRLRQFHYMVDIRTGEVYKG